MKKPEEPGSRDPITHESQPDLGQFVARLLLACTALPFSLFILAALAQGRMQSLSERLILGTLSVFLLGTTAHFFIGRRFPALLPAMVGLFGAGAIGLGLRDGQWSLACCGLFFLGITYDIWPKRHSRTSYFLRWVRLFEDGRNDPS